MNPKPYHLYARPAQEGEKGEPPQGTRFWHFEPCAKPQPYLLIYTDTPPKANEGWQEIDEETTKMIPVVKQWLIKCKNTVNGEHLKAHESDYLSAMSEILDQTEELLKNGSDASGRT